MTVAKLAEKAVEYWYKMNDPGDRKREENARIEGRFEGFSEAVNCMVDSTHTAYGVTMDILDAIKAVNSKYGPRPAVRTGDVSSITSRGTWDRNVVEILEFVWDNGRTVPDHG